MDSEQLKTMRAAGLAQGGPPAVGQDPEEREEKEANRLREEQVRRDQIATVLESGARERLSRIKLVRPALAMQIESILLRMAQSGQLRGRVNEEQLIGLLEQAEESQSKSGAGPVKKGAVVFQRRRDFDDDDF